MVVGSPTKLNLIPSGVMPVVYINQGDAGYDKEFLIYNGDSPYNVPAGVSATIRGKKADGYGVTEAAALTEGSNLVTVTITEQMVAAAGANLYELVFVDTDGLRIATINMVWAVKADALGNAVISDSDLDYVSQALDRIQGVEAMKQQLDANTSGLSAETSARLQEDNALQAAINAEAAARTAADNTLQTNITNEATARAATDNSLQAQINQIVAPSGSAPSAAEVQNARIGLDGYTFDSLGNAIRSQVRNLKNNIDSKIQRSINLLNPDTLIPNYYIKQTTGELVPYTNWQASDYIMVEPGTSYAFLIWNATNWARPQSIYYAFYDSSKTFTHGNYTGQASQYDLVAQQGDVYLRVSGSNAHMAERTPMLGSVSDMTPIVGTTTSDNFVKFGNTLIGDTLKADLDAALEKLDDVTNDVSIILPDEIPIAVGRQITFYKKNVINARNTDDYVVYWSTALPKSNPNSSFDGNVRFEPTAAQIGSYNATVFVMNRYNGKTIAQKSIVIKVVANTERTGKKVLFIGDSLTNAGFYPYEVQHYLSGEGVESIGTRTSTGYLASDTAVTTRVSVNHEGRGGWSAQDYISLSSKSGVDNAFWNPNTSAFDFAYYLTNTGFSMPDVVFINLGTNGTVNPTAEVNAIKTMIASIRAYSSTVPIVVSAIANGNAMQCEYINIYLTRIREMQLAEFDGVMSNVYIAPIYLNINMDTDWSAETVAESARNPREVVRQLNEVHPSKYGYYKFADVYWSVIQSILGE